MAIKVSKVEVWVAEIPDAPGGADRLLEALAEAGANLECVIGRHSPEKPGTGQVFVTPVKGKKVQGAARAVGLVPATGMVTLRVETPNKRGLGHAVMRAIADAGVNVKGISAVALGTKTVAYIGLGATENADRAIKAIKSAGR